MTKTLKALAVAALLACCASSAAAQTALTAAQADVVMQRHRTSAEKAARVVAIMTSISNDARFRAARTPKDYADLLGEKVPLIAAGRAELQAISAEMTALPSVARPNDPIEIRLADQSIDEVADFARMADGVLAGMQELHAAAVAGDRQRMLASTGAIIEASALILDYQAMVFRNAHGNFDPGSSGLARNASVTCFYEGMAAYQRGAFKLTPAPEAAAKMRASAGCLREQGAAGRAAIAREAESQDGEFAYRMLRMQLGQVNGRILESLEQAALELDRVIADLEREGPNPALATRYLPAMMNIEASIMQAQADEDRIIEEANRRL